MARKKAGTSSESNVEQMQENEQGKTLASKLSALDKFCAAATANKKALAGRIVKVPEIKERLNIRYIPTPSEDINRLVGGGLPRGKTTVISGMPDSGKTGILLETIGLEMKRNEKFVCIWVESENSIDIQMIQNLYKIDIERFFFIAQDKNASAEGIGDLLTNLLSSDDLKPDIIVVNSLKMLTTKNETNRSLEKQSMAEPARFNSRLMSKLVPLLAEADCALAIVQPLSTNIAQLMGDNLQLAGGLAIRYGASMIWELRKNSILENDPISKEDGMKIKFFCRKNHCVCDRFPYGSVVYYVEYGKGTEQIFSLLGALIESGIIVRRGSWLYILDSEGEKQEKWSWKSKAEFKADMDNNPDKLEELKNILHNNGGSVIHSATEEEIKEIEEEQKHEEDLLNQILDSE